MYAIYVRSPDFYNVVPHAPAWMNVCFNNERRAFMAAVDGKGEFAFHTQLKPHENEADITQEDALRMFQMGVGAPVEAQILSHGAWTAGHSLVADHMQKGRVFIGGDAAHLFTPTGGLGYNTAVEQVHIVSLTLGFASAGVAGVLLGMMEQFSPFIGFPLAIAAFIVVIPQHRLRKDLCRLAWTVCTGTGN